RGHADRARETRHGKSYRRHRRVLRHELPLIAMNGNAAARSMRCKPPWIVRCLVWRGDARCYGNVARSRDPAISHASESCLRIVVGLDVDFTEVLIDLAFRLRFPARGAAARNNMLPGIFRKIDHAAARLGVAMGSVLELDAAILALLLLGTHACLLVG